MKKYWWIILFIFININVYGAKISEKMDMEIYQVTNQNQENINIPLKLDGETAKAELTNGQLTLLVKPNISEGTIEYVEFKVNGSAAGQSFRVPSIKRMDPSLFHQGINEIKVVVKVRDKAYYGVTQFYVNNKIAIAYNERAQRKSKDYSINQQPTYQQKYIPVLMYHQIKDQIGITKEEISIGVSKTLFEEQIKALLNAGYTPIHFKQLQAYLEGRLGLPNKPFIITADDGYLDNYEKAYPILKQYEVPATFFITTQYVGMKTQYEHFTWEQAKEMEQSGLIDIQSHTHGHTLLNNASETEVYYEVQKSFADIEKHLGKRDVKVLAYPQFLHTVQTQKWVKACGVDLQVTNLVEQSQEAGSRTTSLDIKRIHVSNDMNAQVLLSEIENLTK